MTISNDKNGLKTIFKTEEANQAFEILGTEIEEDILYIDIYVKEYGLNTAFEIYVDGNTVSGYLADMFELEGVITK
jgi:AAA+ ATPase superfamily predicted ATPase